MSDRVSGRPSQRRLAARASLLLGLFALAAGPAAPFVAAASLKVTTPFPAVVAEPGSTASFDLSFDVPTAERVDLKTSGVPQGWTARFRGGGLTIDSVYVNPKSPPSVTLDVEVPDDASAQTGDIVVTATGGGETDTLPLTVRVENAAQGDVSLTTDFAQKKGPATATFTFDVTVHNDTAAEITFSMGATAPSGWTATAVPSGQSQATTTTVKPGSTGDLTVTANPPTDVQAGDYPIQASVNGGGKTASIDLQVTITGTFTMSVSTPDQVLSTSANAGSTQDLVLTIQNTGTAPITNVQMTSSPPTNWKVTFDPATLPSIDSNATQQVTAHITPSSDAIAGDYMVTMTAKGTEASDDVDIRVRVETPQFWWIVGVALIVGVFLVLYWVFRRYGRR